jgi:hypothetical protein
MLRWVISSERQSKLLKKEEEKKKKQEERKRSKETEVTQSSRRVSAARLLSATDNDQILAAQLGVDAATYRLLRQLERREIAPEDYELLGRLDEGVKPKTLGREHLQRFTTRIYIAPSIVENTTASDLLHFGVASPARCAPSSVDVCGVCINGYEDGDELRMLPCSHYFHRDCIDHWLLNSAATCPSCKLDLLPDD